MNRPASEDSRLVKIDREHPSLRHMPHQQLNHASFAQKLICQSRILEIVIIVRVQAHRYRVAKARACKYSAVFSDCLLIMTRFVLIQNP